MVKLNSALLLEQQPLLHKAEEWIAITGTLYIEVDQLLIVKARLAIAQNKPELASNFLQDAYSLNDDRIRLWLLGRSYFEAGEKEKALTAWQNAKIPNNYFMRMGGTLSQEDAEDWYQLTAKKVEPSSSLYAALGAAYYKTEASKSVEYYGKAVELDRGWDSLQQKFRAIYWFGLALEKAGEPDKAKSVYINGIQESKGTYIYFARTGYVRLARILQSQEQYAEAERWLEELVKQTKSADHYLLLGKNALKWEQNLELADEYFQMALQARNYEAGHALQIGESWIEVGQIEKARYYCVEAVPAKFAENWQVPTCQAQILLAEGSSREAYQVIFPLSEQWADVRRVRQVLNEVCQQMEPNDLPSGCQ